MQCKLTDIYGVNTPLRIRFGAAVKAMRLDTSMSQEAFADRCGFARSYMSRLERGNANPSFDAIEKLAIAFDVDVGALFAVQVETTKG